MYIVRGMEIVNLKKDNHQRQFYCKIIHVLPNVRLNYTCSGT